MSSNKVAVPSGSQESGKLLTVSATEVPQIDDQQILIEAIAYAVNPTDWKSVTSGRAPPGAVIGVDASGIVVKVGKNVEGYEIGDYVSTTLKGNSSPNRGGFSQFVSADPITTIKYDKSTLSSEPLPVGVTESSVINTFEGAAAVTLSLATAGVSLSNSLKIRPNKESNASRYILIWGGATSTGIIAIQLAKLVYGLKVITTASKKHHQFLKSLGADETFDYHDSDVVKQIQSTANGKIYYALDTVSTKETYQQTYDATEGSPTESYDNLLFLFQDSIKVREGHKACFSGTRVFLATGVPINFGGTVVTPQPDLVSEFKEFWYELLPPHVHQLKTPNLRVLQPGLESASAGLELLRQDKVSGEKVVFRFA